MIHQCLSLLEIVCDILHFSNHHHLAERLSDFIMELAEVIEYCDLVPNPNEDSEAPPGGRAGHAGPVQGPEGRSPDSGMLRAAGAISSSANHVPKAVSW